MRYVSVTDLLSQTGRKEIVRAALLLLKLCVFKLWWKILSQSVVKGMKKGSSGGPESEQTVHLNAEFQTSRNRVPR